MTDTTRVGSSADSDASPAGHVEEIERMEADEGAERTRSGDTAELALATEEGGSGRSGDTAELGLPGESAEGVDGGAGMSAGIRPPTATRRRPRLVPVLVFALVTAAFFLLCLANSDTSPWDADTSAVFLQGWDLVHGHLLLHGWWSSDVNFYTFDAPILGLCGVVVGMGNQALHVAGALIYTLVFLAACWAVKGGAQGAKLWLRISLVAFLMTGMLFDGALRATLLQVPDHTGTSVFILVAFVLYDRHAHRRWAPWAMLVLLTLGQLGDATVRYIVVPALVVVWVLELPAVRRLRTPRTWVMIAALVSVVASMGIRHVERSHHAYYLTKPATRIAPSSEWHRHFISTYESLLSLFAVPTSGWLHESAARLEVTVFGGIALVVGALAVILVLCRWTKKSSLDRLIVVGCAIYLAAYCFSTMATPGGGSGYEFAGVIPLLAVLSARTFTDLKAPKSRLSERSRLRAAVALTVVASLGAAGCLLSGSELHQARTQDPAQTMALWLEAHGFRNGLGGYWDATPMTVYSGDVVKVRAFSPRDGAFVPEAWGSKAQWYEASSVDMNFVVTGGPRNQISTVTAERAFGAPARTYQVGSYTILVYDYNLLTRKDKVHLPAGA